MLAAICYYCVSANNDDDEDANPNHFNLLLKRNILFRVICDLVLYGIMCEHCLVCRRVQRRWSAAGSDIG